MRTVFRAASWQELEGSLKATDISVPGRTEGRRSWHREQYDICYLLSSVGRYSRLSFPLHLLKRESPDFLLLNGPEAIGIEQVVSSDPEVEKARTRAEHTGRSLHYFDVGLRIETPWAERIASKVDEKTAKLNQPHFERFDQNWLLIHDNDLWAGFLHLEPALSRLRKQFALRKPFLFEYDRLFIMSAGSFIEFAASGEDLFPANELWPIKFGEN